MSTIRAFVAINLSVATLRRVCAAQRELMEPLSAAEWDVKWIAPPNLHVVLRHLGEVGVALPAALAEVLLARVGPLPAFRLGARSIRPVEAPGGRIDLVVGIEDLDSGFEALGAAVAAPLEEIGFMPLDALPPALLAIGRVRDAGEIPLDELLGAAATADFGESLVDELLVYRSDAGVPGSEFRCLARVGLSGRRGAPAPEAGDGEDARPEQGSGDRVGLERDGPGTTAPGEED